MEKHTDIVYKMSKEKIASTLYKHKKEKSNFEFLNN